MQFHQNFTVIPQRCKMYMTREFMNMYKSKTPTEIKLPQLSVSTMELVNPVMRFASRKNNSWFLLTAWTRQRLSISPVFVSETDSDCFIHKFHDEGTNWQPDVLLENNKTISAIPRQDIKNKDWATLQMEKGKFAMRRDTGSTSVWHMYKPVYRTKLPNKRLESALSHCLTWDLGCIKYSPTWTPAK